MSKHSLPFNKANFYVLEQERNMLKITLDFLSTENYKLKTQIEDMKMTVKHNKEQLEEYVTKITDKDKMFEKMTNQIEQLTTRLKVLDAINKKKKTVNEAKSYLNQSSSNIPSTMLNSSLVISKEEKMNENKLNSGRETNRKNEEKIKDFFTRQSEIMEEMNVLKDDIQFLLENKSKSKLKEHLDNSMTSNRSYSSYSSSNRNGLNDSMSILNSTINSNRLRKLNIKERFNFDKNFDQFLSDFNIKKNILIFIDNKNDVWELVKRADLTSDYVKTHPDYIKSVTQGGINSYRGNDSFNQSELEIEKNDSFIKDKN